MAREFAEGILNSREYRESLIRRIKSDTLPAAVETLLYHYAYGKPKESIEVNLGTSAQDLSNLSNEELAVRAEALAKAARVAEQVRAMQTEPGTTSLEDIAKDSVPYGMPGCFELTDLPTNGSKH